MRRAAGAWLIAAAWVAFAGPAAAQDVNVRAQVDRNRIGEQDTLALSIDIFGPSLGQSGGPPDMARLDDFEIVSGPSVSQRFQWINGQTSSTRTYRYVLRPKRTGTLSIPPLGVLVHGRTYRTMLIDVEVVGGSVAAPAPGGRGAPSPPRGLPGTAPGPAAGATAPVLLRAELDTRTAWVGQQVTLRVLLDTQTEILNLGPKDTPTFPGFWAEEIKLPENLEMKRVQRDDSLYNEYTVMKKALFPTTAGNLTIPPLSYQIQVRRRSRDPIESFFFTPTETLIRKTEPLRLEVRPLPEEGRPAGFSGAVGQFNLAVTADRKEAQVNDAIGLKVRVSGEGNLNPVNLIELGTLSDFKPYAPRVASGTSFQGDRLRSERTWDYVLIPLAPGGQTIPPVTFSYFDPRQGEYRTARSAPIGVQVARGTGQPGAGIPAVAQSDVRALREDIRYIKQAPGGLRERSRSFHGTPWFVAALALPLAADLGIFVYARRRGRWESTARLRRERRARDAARRRLKQARRNLGPATARAFYAEVARALTDYVADKFHAAPAGLTHERIEELLAGRGVPADLRGEFHACLEACDLARFAPGASTPEEMRRILERGEETIVALERALGS